MKTKANETAMQTINAATIAAKSEITSLNGVCRNFGEALLATATPAWLSAYNLPTGEPALRKLLKDTTFEVAKNLVWMIDSDGTECRLPAVWLTAEKAAAAAETARKQGLPALVPITNHMPDGDGKQFTKIVKQARKEVVTEDLIREIPTTRKDGKVINKRMRGKISHVVTTEPEDVTYYAFQRRAWAIDNVRRGLLAYCCKVDADAAAAAEHNAAAADNATPTTK